MWLSRCSLMSQQLLHALQRTRGTAAHQDHLRWCNLPWGPAHCCLCAPTAVVDGHNACCALICTVQLQEYTQGSRSAANHSVSRRSSRRSPDADHNRYKICKIDKGIYLNAAKFLIEVLAAVGLYEASGRPRMAPCQRWHRSARLTCEGGINP